MVGPKVEALAAKGSNTATQTPNPIAQMRQWASRRQTPIAKRRVNMAAVTKT